MRNLEFITLKYQYRELLTVRVSALPHVGLPPDDAFAIDTLAPFDIEKGFVDIVRSADDVTEVQLVKVLQDVSPTLDSTNIVVQFIRDKVDSAESSDVLIYTAGVPQESSTGTEDEVARDLGKGLVDIVRSADDVTEVQLVKVLQDVSPTADTLTASVDTLRLDSAESSDMVDTVYDANRVFGDELTAVSQINLGISRAEHENSITSDITTATIGYNREFSNLVGADDLLVSIADYDRNVAESVLAGDILNEFVVDTGVTDSTSITDEIVVAIAALEVVANSNSVVDTGVINYTGFWSDAGTWNDNNLLVQNKQIVF